MLNAIITILVTVFVFGILIFIHEFGHYIVARKFGVGIIEFAIGMGPKLFSWKGKYNDFSIRAIPIGGFVNMVGEYDEDIPEEHAYKMPLNSRPVWKRMLIVLAGPFMNLFLAFVVMVALVASSEVIASTVVGEFVENSVSDDCGLKVDDEIIEINGKNIYCYDDMRYKVFADGIEPLDITVLRDGKEVVLENVSFGIVESEGMAYGMVDFRVYVKEKTVANVLYESFFQSVSTVYMTVDSLIDTFAGRYGMEAVGGPIAIGGQISDTIEQSSSVVQTIQNIANLLVMISVSLGIFNLLPIPVLDGGRLLFYVIEAIRRKPMNPKVEQNISVAFTMLLFALMIFVAFKDVINLV